MFVVSIVISFFLFLYTKLCLILAGSHAKYALHVAGEVIGGVEIQLIGYIRNRQVFAFQQAGYFFGSEVLDEETGIMTAGLDAAFREVIGRDIQARGVILYGAMLADEPLLQQVDEAPHDPRALVNTFQVVGVLKGIVGT